MKYRFYGDLLQLAKYILTYTELNEFDEMEENETVEPVVTEEIIVDEEMLNDYKAMLDGKGIEYTVENIDITDYEWLNNKSFSQEEQKLGYVQKAIELGELAYYEWVSDVDINAQRDLLLVYLTDKVFELELGASS